MKKNISINDIRAKVSEIEKNSQVDPNRLQSIYNQLNTKIAEFQTAVLAGDQKAADKLALEIDKLNREKQVAKSLAYVAESGGLKHQLEANSGLQEMVQTFEKQQRAAMVDYMAERDSLIEEYKLLRSSFLRCNYKLGQVNHKMFSSCNDMSVAAEHNHSLTPLERQSYHSEYPLLAFGSVDVAAQQREAFGAGHHGLPFPASMEQKAE